MRIVHDVLLDLRGNIGKALLSALSLLLAVLAVIAIYVTGSVSRQVVIATSEQKYGRSITVAAQLALGTVTTLSLRTDLAILDKMLTGSGSHYVLSVQTGTASPGPSQDTGVAVTFLAGDLNAVRRTPLLKGRWLDPDNYPYPGGVLLNQAGARSLGGVGTTVRIKPQTNAFSYPQKVVGVIADGDPQPNAYASLMAGLTFRPFMLEGQSLTLDVHDATASESDLVSHTVAATKLLSLPQPSFDPSSVDAQQVDQVAQLSGDVTTLQQAFLLVALVALLVATVGLISIGFASIAQRSRELSIRRAIGATRLRIVTLVMASSIATGVIAAGLSILIGWASVLTIVPHLLNRSLELQHPKFPWHAASIGLGLSLLAAVLSGVIPAAKAAALDPAGALRA